jgi:hypothetical protein
MLCVSTFDSCGADGRSGKVSQLVDVRLVRVTLMLSRLSVLGCLHGGLEVTHRTRKGRDSIARALGDVVGVTLPTRHVRAPSPRVLLLLRLALLLALLLSLLCAITLAAAAPPNRRHRGHVRAPRTLLRLLLLLLLSISILKTLLGSFLGLLLRRKVHATLSPVLLVVGSGRGLVVFLLLLFLALLLREFFLFGWFLLALLLVFSVLDVRMGQSEGPGVDDLVAGGVYDFDRLAGWDEGRDAVPGGDGLHFRHLCGW